MYIELTRYAQGDSPRFARLNTRRYILPSYPYGSLAYTQSDSGLYVCLPSSLVPSPLYRFSSYVIYIFAQVIQTLLSTRYYLISIYQHYYTTNARLACAPIFSYHYSHRNLFYTVSNISMILTYVEHRGTSFLEYTIFFFLLIERKKILRG